ncbi:MFS transporter [Arthrobacter zhaoguopingii]|uniref:MFS transporter n=1 Tax=Arthrobacter zhaoguopingii TaxID=2681491 RepID=UPI0013576C74|nr:MFS transporter [Arthrobacter zhaoguopingii]
MTSSTSLIALGTGRARVILLATVLASGLAQLGGSVVNVALPDIGVDLGADLTALQWIVNAYTLSLSAFLLLGGSLGDRYGRRRIFVIGVVLFAITSIACAVAPDASMLIAFRAAQGAAAALMVPGSLAIIEAVFIPADRSAAVGAWSGLGGVAAAVGPVLGGFLVQSGPDGWRTTFLLNLPLAAAVLLATRQIPETRDEDARGLPDLTGAVLAAAGLGSLMFGLTEGAGGGWTPGALIAVAIGTALLAGFLINEARVRYPLMPLSLFTSGVFRAANAVTFVVYAALGGALFLLPLQLQLVAGFTPVISGAALLPVTVLMLLFSARAGRLAQRIGPRWPMTIGPILAGVGLILLGRIGAEASLVADVLPAVLVFGAGLSLAVAPLTATTLAAAPPQQVGVASAVNNDIARVAGLLAVALLPSLVGIDQAAYASPEAFSEGFGRATLVAGLLCAAGGLLSAVTLRDHSLAGACEEAAQAGAATHTPDLIPVRHGR